MRPCKRTYGRNGGGASCCLNEHDPGTPCSYKCASPVCPGLPFPASEHAHPPDCGGQDIARIELFVSQYFQHAAEVQGTRFEGAISIRACESVSLKTLRDLCAVLETESVEVSVDDSDGEPSELLITWTKSRRVGKMVELAGTATAKGRAGQRGGVMG